MAEAPAASSWFRGAVVAYASDVVSAQPAAAMAGERELLDADAAVALTGATPALGPG